MLLDDNIIVIPPRLSHSSSKQRVQGFTLIEVMVALLIVSVGLITVINATAKHADVSSLLEKKVVASWVISNRISELRHSAKTDRIKEENKTQSVKMGGYEWRVKSDINETDVEKVFLVTVEVREQGARDKDVVASVTTAIADRL